ncbi:cytoplasmic dynein 2 intermediate chain 1 isoform X2 [Microcaecilia unicolor]|uniref:WD repeat-containing protein 60 isoform X2 n=1 Tax=Microcaecilia unicolor TaxID=1415580 RepID=A0A6P7XGH7_9AMPH|nr:WD repeat-containing protein 60 isoform X2 [Microcaecilia unicolor]
MHHQRRKTREDTWRSDELKKHLRSSYSSVQGEEKKPRERRLQRDDDVDSDRDLRPRNKEKEERHKYREGDRERHRELDKAHHEDWERELDRIKEKEQRARKEKSREKDRGTDRKLKEGALHADLEFGLEEYGRKELSRTKERPRRRGSEDLVEKEKQRIEDRERRHQERKEKEGRIKVNGQTKDKHESMSGYRDPEREHRRRKLKETDPEFPNADKEKRYRDRKEQENAEREKRYRTVQEVDLLHDKERRHRSSKEEPQGFTAQDLEEKRKEKRYRERALLDEDRERRHRERKERAEKEERRKRDYERPKHRRLEESLKHKPAADIHSGRDEQGQEKTFGKDKESANSEESERKLVAESSEVVHENYSANYEEDFEDYADDFEEEEEEEEVVEDDGDARVDTEPAEKLNGISSAKRAEIEEIQKAINAENERVAAFPPRHSQSVLEREQRKDPQDFKNKMPHRGKYIDFVTAKHRQISQKITDKQKKRSMELLRLIDLDFSITFSFLDLAPVNEYDMYIRNFGKRNTKQVYVQCNEDCVDRDLQTDEIDTIDKWTQHPGESALVSGGPSNSQALSLDAPLIPKIDSQKLANFLRSACQVIAVLLEEDRAERQTVQNLNSQETNLSISNGCFQLNTNLPFLHERKISRLHFSQVQRHVLLTVHDLPQDLSTVRLDRKYIICVWNIWEPSIPQKILVCEAQIKCCCFSPGKATLVFAGTVDGSVVMWDLRENSSMHHCKKIINTDWIFRSPTFSTDGILTTVNHVCSVEAIEPVPTSVSKMQNHGLSRLESQEEMLGLSFQIASLDENGILNLWVVIELQTVDPAGSQSDLGLIPGGRVKLVHSSAVHLISSFFPKDITCLETPQTLNIKFLPLDSNHFVIGTDIGVVIHGTRHGLRVPPKVYRPQQYGTRPVRVTSIDFSPFGEPAFLVGCSDGSIRLHFMIAQYPIMQWNDSTKGQSIVAVRWALTRPTVFFVLDATSNIYIWDLLESDLHPAAKETIRVMDMDVLGEPEKNSGLLGLAFAKKSGLLEIQYLKKKWAISQPEEAKMLHKILQEAV